MGEVTRDTFKSMEVKDKLNVLFDKIEANELRLGYITAKLGKKIKIDGFCSTIGGFIGGVAAMIGKTIIFR